MNANALNEFPGTAQNNRYITYSGISNELALLSDLQLLKHLTSATPLGNGTGGKTVLLEINRTNIFVKKIPLTDREKQPQNIMSTANIFSMPLYCQYGIGSPGLGAWRELSLNILSTNWALTRACVSFPLMYHWRILPKAIPKCTSNELKDIERWVVYWNNSIQMRKRLEENLRASYEIVLFLEYIPQNLEDWLKKQSNKAPDIYESTCCMVEKTLQTTLSFMQQQSLLHFDLNLVNILTDGEQLYFTDFGLGIHKKFMLSKSEKNFFKNHASYDQCYSIAGFITSILINFFSEEGWLTKAEHWLTGSYDTIINKYKTHSKKLAPRIEEMIMRYLPLTILMNTFLLKLQKCKTHPYPNLEMEAILQNLL